MPQIKPVSGESQDVFVYRFMDDADSCENFPDTKQRFAAGMKVWSESKTPILRRNFDVGGMKIEKREDTSRKIVGHAAVFDKLSVDLWGFREKIAPGAFSDAIKEDDVRGLWNHDPNYVLGRNKAGTLRLNEDKIGLAIEIDPPDTQFARDLMVSIDRGDISQMSFGFSLVADEWDYSDRSNPVRTLKKVKLYDVSPVTYPAYPDTDVEMNDWRSKYDLWQERSASVRKARRAEYKRKVTQREANRI